MALGNTRRRRSQAPAALLSYVGLCGVGGLAVTSTSTGCGGEAIASEAVEAAAEVASPAPAYDPRESLAPMIKAVAPSVVAVYTGGAWPGTGGSGSGFVLTDDGLVVTNHHVVAGASAVKVRTDDGETYDAEVLGTDEATDLAVLRLQGASSLPTVTLGESAGLQVGDWVVAIGNPLGLDHSATVGIVSGKGRGSLGLYRDSYIDFLQTDADIAPGSSGGPLFDLKGRVIGITTAVGGGNGPGFAIPIDQAKRVVAQLRDSGHVARGWLGAANVPGEDRGRGAKLGAVYADTPAARAGLREGDLVVSVDGAAIASFSELRGRVATTGPGESLELGVERDGKPITVTVTLEERPDGADLEHLRPDDASAGRVRPGDPPARTLPFGIPMPAPKAEPPAPAPTRLGVRARQADDGLEIVDVEPGSLAEALGLRSGDVVRSINGTRIADSDDVRRALAADDRQVSATFRRDGADHDVTLDRS